MLILVMERHRMHTLYIMSINVVSLFDFPVWLKNALLVLFLLWVNAPWPFNVLHTPPSKRTWCTKQTWPFYSKLSIAANHGLQNVCFETYDASCLYMKCYFICNVTSSPSVTIKISVKSCEVEFKSMYFNERKTHSLWGMEVVYIFVLQLVL